MSIRSDAKEERNHRNSDGNERVGPLKNRDDDKWANKTKKLYHVFFCIGPYHHAFTLECRELHPNIKAMASLVIEGGQYLKDNDAIKKDRFGIFDTKLISTEAEVLRFVKDPDQYMLDTSLVYMSHAIKPEGAV